MKNSVVLYTAIAACAIAGLVAAALWNPATSLPGGLDNRAEIEALREGDMRKLNFHAEARPVPDIAYDLAGGGEGRLADYRGKLVLVNFWATWCAPCRKEMPMLADLQTAMGGDAFEVVTIATGRNAPQAMQAFLDEIGVTNLPLHNDSTAALARAMSVLGLPTTVIVSPEGVEIARLTGEADWSSDSATALLRALLAPSKS